MEIKCFIYLSKKLTVPFTRELRCVSWNQNRGFVCAGGVDGSVRLFKLHPDSDKNMNNPFYMNSALEGHGPNSNVEIAQWNEYYQKLTTSDDSGMIIVWSPNQHDNSWYEEMVNNRNKSTIMDMKWSPDGQKVSIVYEDGQVIVGSVEGNRIWAKDVSTGLCACAFNVDSSLLLVGLMDGEVHAYDSSGNFAFKVPMICIESMELETALATKDAKKDTIISMEYFVPPLFSKDPEPRGAGEGLSFGAEGFLPSVLKLDTFEKNHIARSPISPNRPRLAIAFQNGVIQLMRNEMDSQPIIIRERNTVVRKCHWSPDGSVLAVGAKVNAVNVLLLFSPTGEKYQALPMPDKNFNCFTWKGDGLAIGCGVDNSFYLATVRPRYKWAYCNHTVVYAYAPLDINENIVTFFETKMNEKHEKILPDVINIESHGEYCVIANLTSEISGPYQLQLCNSIGTPLDVQNISIEPKYLAINDTTVVAANYQSFVVWNFTVPRATGFDAYKQPAKQDTMNGEEGAPLPLHHIDQTRENGRPSTSAARHNFGGGAKQSDNIKSIALGANFLLISREQGTLYRYNLPTVTLQHRTPLGYTAEKMSLNCSSTRLAVISTNNIFKLFDIRDNGTQVVSGFEKKDIWDMKWDNDKEDTIAIMEKSRLLVVQGTTAADPVPNQGYICSFRDLTVRTIQMQYVMQNPKDFDRGLIADIEVKTLRKAKELLDAGKISEANVFIEQNSHPMLWKLLAKMAMAKLDFRMAEHAFVKLRDYLGICFLKRLESIQSDQLRRAEVHMFYGNLEAAEKIYLDNDRRDLAIDMHRKMNNWPRILKLLQQSGASNSDALMIEAWKEVGDWFAERQKWAMAAKHYAAGNHFEELVDCYIKLDDFGKMEQLMHQLPDNHAVLLRLAEHFSSAGLCELAVDCYVRCEQHETALDTSIKLNQWDMAVDISKRYHLRDVESLLGKYTADLTGNNEKTMAAVQLFRKAGKFLLAARKVFEMAQDESNNATAKRLKKLYVLGALLVEMYRDQNKAQLAKDKDSNAPGASSATVALQGLLEEDKSLSMADARLIDTAWRGAEAWHFLMLAHQQLYSKEYVSALKTCLVVSEYDEFVDTYEIHCMLALVAVHAKQFGIASKAFMKINSLPNVTDEEKEKYNHLAMEIFLKYPPQDTRDAKIECTTCEAIIPDCSIVCPNASCNTRFPICIASGRPLLDYQFWLCPSCKHRAYEQEIQSYKFCPLCHWSVADKQNEKLPDQPHSGFNAKDKYIC